MAYSFDTLGLSDAALPLVRDLVLDRLGVHYADTRLEALRDRLAPLVLERGFQSFLDYYYLLKYDPSAETEWRRVSDALSVPETYFWREIDQLRAIVTHVVPELVARARGAPLRLWSVPCASGEEPLTLAMLLNEQGWFQRAPIEIHAGDASPAAIGRALAGQYRERSFRAMPEPLKAKYFTAGEGGWQISPELHARVRTWSVLNLMADADVAPMTGAPIVVCRNVLIYFSNAGVRRVVERFARLMPSPGYLCVGASESLLKLNTAFELEEIGGAFMYVKRN